MCILFEQFIRSPKETSKINFMIVMVSLIENKSPIKATSYTVHMIEFKPLSISSISISYSHPSPVFHCKTAVTLKNLNTNSSANCTSVAVQNKKRRNKMSVKILTDIILLPCQK